MVAPKVIIIKEHGTNCEEESKLAFEKAGADTDIVHMEDLIRNKKKIFDYQILMFPGGFSYGDDLGSGMAWANRIRNNLSDELIEFVNLDKLILGICNGFQLITNLGLVPGLNNCKLNNHYDNNNNNVSDNNYNKELENDANEKNRIFFYPQAALMHNKITIIDGEIIMTGSMNYSANGNTRNDENLIIIKSKEIAALYEGEFKEIFEEAT